MDNLRKRIEKRLDSFRDKVADSTVMQYFNPESNAGNNFWSTPVAKGLGGAQKAVQSLPTPVQKFNEGFAESSAFGLYDAPGAKSNTRGQTAGYGLGYTAGLLNPLNPVNKIGLFAKIGNVGSQAVTRALPKIAPKLTAPTAGRIASFAGKTALPVAGSELAQTAAYGGAKSALGQDFDPLSDFAFGLGVRGALGQFGKLATPIKSSLKGVSPRAFNIHPDDKALLINVIGRFQAKQKLHKDDLYDLQNLTEHYLGEKFRNAPTKKIMEAFDYVLAAQDGGVKGTFPKMNIAGDNISSEAVVKKGKIIPSRIPTQTEIANRVTTGMGKPDLYDQRAERIARSDFGRTPLETPHQQSFRGGLDQAQQEAGKRAGRISQSQGKQTHPFGLQDDTLSNLNKRQSEKSQQSDLPSFDNIVRSTNPDVKSKVGFFDLFRTPDRVLTKFGLGKEAKQLRGAYDTYIGDLPKEIDKITAWSKRADSPESRVAIFKYLDGQKVTLSENDLKIAKEIRQYLSEWADRLGLPKEGRIANYITHIFDRELIEKEFDPDLAKLIRERVAGSVYDPFLEKRLGALGYKEDVWQALDAYVKRATRKVNLDPVLKKISDKSEHLEESQFDYVKNYIARVNMQPTKLDNMIDNTIKQVIGYKLGQRPTTVITRALRQAGYRGALGLNVGSALRNLTQISNTYAKLGEKYTAIGYIKMLSNGRAELEREGVLRNDFIQDRSLNATKKFWENTDKVLFSLFELAERVNRGSAYYGAKSQALAKGATEREAIEYAKKIVRDTQFTFGTVDTPKVLSSDVGKTLGQFQSFNIKQAEFLAEMIKNKEFKGLARYTLSSLAMVYTIGELIGIDPLDAIPFSGVPTGETKLGQTPAVNAILKTKDAIIGGKDQYGNEMTPTDRLRNLGNAIIPVIPGGVQAKKTIQGLEAGLKGYSESRSGRIQYPVNQDPLNITRAAIFGKSQLPEARQYFDEERTPLGEQQSEFFKQAGDKRAFYDEVHATREQNRVENELKEQVKESGEIKESDNKIFYFEDGEVKSIRKDRNLKEPELTGDGELDKLLISAYKSDLTAAKKDIAKMYELGLISVEEAVTGLARLEELGQRYAKAKKGRALKVPPVKVNLSQMSTTRQGSGRRSRRAKLRRIQVKPTRLVAKPPKSSVKV